MLAFCFAAAWAQEPVADAHPGEQVQEQIRERVERLRDGGLGDDPNAPSLEGVSLNEGVARFYERRNFAPAWTLPELREALAGEIRNLHGDGLNPEDYGLSALEKGPADANAAALAAFDFAATRGYILALGHLFKGKVNPASLDAQWSFDSRTMTPDEALGYMLAAVDSGDLHKVFKAARPDNAAYERMRVALAQLREIAARRGWPQLKNGTTLEPGADDPQVAVLRKRLSLSGYLLPEDTNGSTKYDAAVEAAVRQYQIEQYLDVDGRLGPATINALNVPVRSRISQLRANLERGRWLLHQLQGDYLLADIAGYELTFFRNNELVWRSPVQVGKPYRGTPEFKSQVSYLKLNPAWTVPPTVLKEDILPRVREDLGYLAARKLRVFDGAGQELDPAKLDWERPGNVILRQDAGPDNALGRAVLRFPNPYAVYLHDTPHRELYSASQRAFSSGCIRVEKIMELVRLLMEYQGWDAAAIDAELANPETHSVKLDKPVPVLIGYWTVDVPVSGRFAFKTDVYERDAPLLKALDAKPDKANKGTE